MKNIFLILLTVLIFSCRENTNKSILIKQEDTILVKKKNKLIGFFSEIHLRSSTYYWIKNNDTLNFKIHISESKRDSTLYLSLSNTKPIEFKTALKYTTKAFSLIEKEFKVSKIKSIAFEIPLYYPDLINKLSQEYESKYGRKIINYKEYNNFLMQSSLNKELNDFLKPINKKVKRFIIEKFHLLEKKDYKFYLPNYDFSKYPEFTIHGVMIEVYLSDIKLV